MISDLQTINYPRPPYASKIHISPSGSMVTVAGYDGTYEWPKLFSGSGVANPAGIFTPYRGNIAGGSGTNEAYSYHPINSLLTFSASTHPASGIFPQAFSWYFGDGTFSSSNPTTHTYLAASPETSCSVGIEYSDGTQSWAQLLVNLYSSGQGGVLYPETTLFPSTKLYPA